MDDIPVVVSEDLDFDMAGAKDRFLDNNLA